MSCPPACTPPHTHQVISALQLQAPEELKQRLLAYARNQEQSREALQMLYVYLQEACAADDVCIAAKVIGQLTAVLREADGDS